MSQLGRISGQLLKENLTRNGHDLAFDTDLLYLSVVDPTQPLKVVGIGINNINPSTELDVSGTTKTTDLDVTTQADLADLTVLGSTITSNTGTLNLSNNTGDQVTYQNKLVIDDIDITSNIISTNNGSVNLELRPHGSGTVDIYADTNVYGNITVTGNIRTDGTITVGDANTDNITINADVASNIIPDQTDTYTLGDVDHKWKDVWVQNIYADNIISGDITVDGVNLTTRQGNIYYVSVNGNDTNTGTHQNDTFKTIYHALSEAIDGDTVYVYPGRYEEIFPLTVPVGVTVHGVSLRSVVVFPTAATMYNDAFHMTGDATVEDFTLTGFRQDFVSNTGHAFAFEPGFKVTSRSPYVRNVTVITYGTPTVLSVSSTQTEVVAGLTRIKNIVSDIVRNVPVSPSIGNAEIQNTLLTTSDLTTAGLLEDLLDIVISIINNGADKTSLDLLTIIANSTAVSTGMLANAAAILVANTNFIKQEVYAYMVFTYPLSTIDDTLTKNNMGLILDAMEYDIIRGGNEHSVYAGLGFWTYPANDPRGYASGDAGAGANLNGALADPDSREAAMLFNGVTFITPNQESITATNGARVEWTNSFTYFADKSMYLYSSPEGFAGNGKTRVKITNTTGTWAVGNTLNYYDTDGTTVLASGVIESIDGDFYNIDSRVLGFEQIQDRAGKTVVVHGNAKLSTAVKKFGTASLALDGTGDYLSVASQPDFAFGTGDFTIEGWFYRTNAALATLIDFRPISGTTPYQQLNLSSTGVLRYAVNGATVITGSSLTLNTWVHVAVSRAGSSTKLFVNGTQSGSTYTDTNNYSVNYSLTIGATNLGVAAYAGYIDDVRITKGVARYTATFTLPTAQLTGNLSTVLLITLNGLNNSTAIADNGITLQDLRTSAGGRATIIDFADYSDFGVEVRSIGSASVYGEYGIYGDGDGVIAYLIGQNLAYIGNEKEVDNDPTTVIQANEIVELNRAKIYYQSADAKGDFRIGDLFYVNQQTGEVTFPNSTITIGTSLTFDNGVGDVTYLDATKIETGDFRISGNTVETLTQDFNIQAASNLINLQSNVTITGNLDVTGNVTIGGNITIGDQSTDTVSFVAGVNSDIVPNNPLGVPVYNLGTSSKQWLNLYSTQVTINKVQIDTNEIRSLTGNTDLTLLAAGSGNIYVPSNNVQLDQNLTVNGTTYLKDTTIVGTVTQTGAVTQTGNLTQTGSTEITGTLTVGSTAQFQDIKIDTNIITTTIGNNNLVLSAAGTGRVIVPSDDVSISQTLTITGTTSTTTINNTGTVTSGTFSTGDIRITSNNITTTIGSNNLVLEANGTGKIYVPTNDVSLGKTLTVVGNTTLADTSITGTLTQVGNTTQTGDVTQTGNYVLNGNLTVSNIAQFKDVNITNNIISTTLSNSNLQLSAAGTGRIYVPTNNVTIENNLTVVGTSTTATINNTGTVTSGTFSTGNISISGSTIQTTVGSSNLQLQAAGTGYIVLEQFDVQENEIRINTGADMVLTPNGTGIVTVNSTQSIKIPVGNTASRPGTPVAGMIRFNTTLVRYEGYDGTNWIRLDGIEDSDGNTKITAELTPGANDNTIRFYTNSTQVADLTSTRFNVSNVDVGNININNNVISTTSTNTNLVLTPNGTGSVRTGNFSFNGSTITNTVNNSITYFNQTGNGYVKINSTGGFVIPTGITEQRPALFDVGMIRYNIDPENFRVEVWDGGNWVNAGQAAGGGVTVSEAQDIGIVSAIIFG